MDIAIFQRSVGGYWVDNVILAIKTRIIERYNLNFADNAVDMVFFPILAIFFM